MFVRILLQRQKCLIDKIAASKARSHMMGHGKGAFPGCLIKGCTRAGMKRLHRRAITAILLKIGDCVASKGN